MLDSALCNHKLRRTFLNHLKSNNVNFKHDLKLQSTLNVILWMTARNVNVDSINLKIFTTMSNKKVLKLHRSNMSTVNNITRIEITMQTKVQPSFISLLRNKNLLSKEKVLSTNKALTLILQHCTAIQHLVITNNSHMGDQTLLSASTGFSSLTFLALCGCSRLTVVSVKSLVHGNPRLVTLRLLNNPHVLGSRVCEVLSESPLPLLSSLVLTFSNSDSRAVHPSLSLLFASCTALTALSTNSWDALLHAHDYPSLTSLEVAHSVIPYHSEVQWQSRTRLLSVSIGVKNMRDATAAYIASTHPQLTALHVSHSSEITNAAMHSLFSHCPALRHLTLSNCPLISSGAMHTLCFARQCLFLESLDISHAALITVEDVLQVIRSCSALRRLVVVGCNGGDVDGLRAAVQRQLADEEEDGRLEGDSDRHGRMVVVY
jgi:hypothetical protein